MIQFFCLRLCVMLAHAQLSFLSSFAPLPFVPGLAVQLRFLNFEFELFVLLAAALMPVQRLGSLLLKTELL